MKASTTDLRALLHGSTSAAFADLVTVTLADATVARWTTDLYDLVWGGNTYLAGGTGSAPTVAPMKKREAVGLEVSTLELTLGCGPAGGATIGGIDLRRLAVNGVLDDARVTVHRAYMATPGGAVVGVVARFEGLITDCEADSYEVRARVQSDLYKLEEQLPRHLIRERCSWALGDVGCGVNLAAFTESCTSGSASTAAKIFGGAIVGFGTSFAGGTITFTSGVLAGQKRTIQSTFLYGPGIQTGFIVAQPFSEAPSPGDGFDAVPGCDKTISTCGSIYSNLDRRRGFDFVPSPEQVTR